MREEDVILYDHKGKPLRWWIEVPAYTRKYIGFISPEAREKQRGNLARRGDVGPLVELQQQEDAEGCWLPEEEEEGEEA